MPKAKYLNTHAPTLGAHGAKYWAQKGWTKSQLNLSNKFAMTQPHFHKLKAGIPVVSHKRGTRKQLLMEEEIPDGWWYNRKQGSNAYGHWEDNSDPYHHIEGFSTFDDHGDGTGVEHVYYRSADRSALLGPWRVVASHAAYAVDNRPASAVAIRAPTQTIAGPTVLPRTPTPAPQRRDLPNVPGATYPPAPSTAPSVRGSSWKSGARSVPFSYAPFRGFNSAQRAPARRSARSVRYADLYPKERICVRDYPGGWAAFKLLPYATQIATLKRCTSARRY